MGKINSNNIIKWSAAFAAVALLGFIMVALDRVEAKDNETTSPYVLDVKPLSTVECGQCHFSVFQAIKNEGGKHQIDCVLYHR